MCRLVSRCQCQFSNFFEYSGRKYVLTSGGVFADGRDNIRSILSNEENNSVTIDVNKSRESGPKESDFRAEDYVHPIIPDGSGSAGSLTGGSSDDIFSTTLSDRINSLDDDSKSGLSYQLDKKFGSVEGFSMGRKMRKTRKYRVDILPFESLAALATATLDRLFIRDYDIIMSMIPLPHSSVLPRSKGPIHFGPPSQSSMTPWMKLVLYSAVSGGHLSVALIKGQCLRLLPAPLAGCEKAIVWSWDGSAVGGLGGKFEGNLVKGSILLHCLNSLLKFSAVLVQPLSRYDLDDGGKIVTRDVPLPLSGALSECQRLKLANRQRGTSEVLSFDGKILRSYALTPIYETTTRPVEDSLSLGTTKGESEDSDSKEVTLPSVNLLFDRSELCPFEIGACLQANQPVSLIAEASAASAFLAGE